ncbi:MAG TPA: NAD(P)-dependent oxidoreductase [Opitutales bacterium]|jgi:3-hydroxyisobutyrate dehydrogenase|nr:NAD(P)-dependent oxidoreductase [Opitutales bacterium]
MAKASVAFLGLGIMGSGMANRLLGAGFPLTVYNRNAEKAQPLAAAGAKIAATPRAAAAGADFVISMLADDVAARAVWLGAEGALAGAKPGTVLIECSTVSQDWVKELAAAAKQENCPLLDAPVTGTKPHAASGELTFLVGGEAAVLEKARPVLAVMSKAILHVGPNGTSVLLKLLNNFLCAVHAVSFAEALALIENSPLDRAQALDFLLNGNPGSPIVKTMAARMTERTYVPNFSMKLMAKDLGYSIALGKSHSVNLAMVERASEVMQQAIASGLGEKDFSAVAEYVRKK